jgi:hypothetical protein
MKYEEMTTDELEFTLPTEVEREEKRVMPCANCTRDITDHVRYEQYMYRHDSYFDGRRTRIYGISYVNMNSRKKLFETERSRSLRDTLIEAHRMLDEAGVRK